MFVHFRSSFVFDLQMWKEANVEGWFLRTESFLVSIASCVLCFIQRNDWDAICAVWKDSIDASSCFNRWKQSIGVLVYLDHYLVLSSDKQFLDHKIE